MVLVKCEAFSFSGDNSLVPSTLSFGLSPSSGSHSCPQWHEQAPMEWQPVTGPGFCVALVGVSADILAMDPAVLTGRGCDMPFYRRNTVRTRGSVGPRAKSLLLSW